MQNGALRRAAELSAVTRQTMEALLGRSLKDDEAVSINVYKPAPTGDLRQQISKQLLERIDKTAAKYTNRPDYEIEAAHELESAIDEAVHHVRHHAE